MLPASAESPGGRLAGLGSLSRRTWIIVGVVVALLALLAGYMLFGRGGDDAVDAGTVAAAHKTATPPATIVTTVAMTNKDLTNGYKAVLVPGGAAVKGQVTLDLCGYRFTSESHRVARRQVGVVNAKGGGRALERGRRLRLAGQREKCDGAVAGGSRALPEGVREGQRGGRTGDAGRRHAHPD